VAGIKDVNLNIRISEDLRKEFYRIAENNAQNPSALVRRWIENYLKGGSEMKSIFKLRIRIPQGSGWTWKTKECASLREACKSASRWVRTRGFPVKVIVENPCVALRVEDDAQGKTFKCGLFEDILCPCKEYESGLSPGTIAI